MIDVSSIKHRSIAQRKQRGARANPMIWPEDPRRGGAWRGGWGAVGRGAARRGAAGRGVARRGDARRAWRGAGGQRCARKAARGGRAMSAMPQTTTCRLRVAGFHGRRRFSGLDGRRCLRSARIGGDEASGENRLGRLIVNADHAFHSGAGIVARCLKVDHLPA